MKYILILLLLTACSKPQAEQLEEVKDYNYTPKEIEFSHLINHLRDSIGLDTLILNNHISFKSEQHNFYMISKNIISHDNNYQRFENIIEVLNCTKVGEVLAYNYQTNHNVLIAWINSPAHDTILVADFKRIGISIRYDEFQRMYYTVIFSD